MAAAQAEENVEHPLEATCRINCWRFADEVIE